MNEYLRFRDRFAEALDPRFYPIEYLDRRIVEGSAFLWASENAALVAELKTYPSGTRVIHCLVAAGNASEIVETLKPAVEAWGKQQGCAFAEVASRFGWVRILKDYEPHQMTVRKEL